ncbi:SDR family oxidoreductase [Rhodococcus qingshengii]|uniref:SDR family oxidoreductase n=1 Tax=Rhodococcus erythropolis TaxID=1833 RepID=UPI0035ADB6F7
MKIVIFGSGLIGSQVAAGLADAEHDVKALGRADGIDVTTSMGIAEAVEGADVVVDLTNSPSWSDEDVLALFRDGTGHILAAEVKAGVGHHVILSIVGADRLPDSGYMRAKVTQEDLVKAGPIP